MLVIGAGATGVQVASIFNAFGSHVTLFEAAPRILMSEDHDVAAAVRAALQASGIRVFEQAGTIERFESCPAGVRLIYTKTDTQEHIEATVAVVAAGWVANTAGLDLAAAGVRDRPARLRAGGLPASHHRGPHLRRRGYHRAPDGRPRGRPRRLPGRHQRRARQHHRPARRGQPHRQLHRPRVRLGRGHRGHRPHTAAT